ncbi:hypothetical protein BGX38DRAFT_1203548 [Terfezia claveryi]|nr:hypothetical protein BGX38DRAFT_1203548 [Terfezia claveryi]
MPDSKYKIIKDGWGSRANFQGSHGLSMSPDDLEEGNAILEKLQELQEQGEEQGKGQGKGQGKEQLPTGTQNLPLKKSRNQYEYEAHMKDSYLKQQAAKEAAEVWEFTPTGDPELDLIIAAGLSDLENNPDIMT